jgi:probable phosphoglycerate mutase
VAATRQLILVRHGNTFGPGDRVVWIGAGEDLPLVEAGREQARRLGRVLRSHGVRPAVILHAPLCRTREHAEIVAAELGGAPLRSEPRLLELDYGAWSGLSNEEITDRFGAEAVRRWKDDGVWPEAARFAPAEAQVRLELRELAGDLVREILPGERALLVSSNGRLRWFPELAHERSRALRTGHAGKLEHEGRGWRLVYWDVEPTEEAAL